MTRILPFIAVVLTIVNAVRKVLDKLRLMTTMYSWNWAGVYGRKIRNMGIQTDSFIVGIQDGVQYYYTWWKVNIPVTARHGEEQYCRKLIEWANENIVASRLGKGVYAKLYFTIPWYAQYRIGLDKNGCTIMAIKHQYSVRGFAETHSISQHQVYDILKEFAVGLYRRMTLDGLYPPDVFI